MKIRFKKTVVAKRVVDTTVVNTLLMLNDEVLTAKSIERQYNDCVINFEDGSYILAQKDSFEIVDEEWERETGKIDPKAEKVTYKIELQCSVNPTLFHDEKEIKAWLERIFDKHLAKAIHVKIG